MKENKVLYEIKKLEKSVIRSLLEDCTDFLGERQLVLTPTQMQIIDYILEHYDDDVYQSDLEKILNLRRATVSGVLQTMEKKGLIKRVYKTNDARKKQVILQESSKKIFDSHNKKLKDIEEKITQDISKQEMDIFLSVLIKMQTNMQKIGKDELNKGEKKW